MAATKDDVALTSTWVDLTVQFTDLVSASAFVQCKGPDEVLIYWGGASAPTGSSGTLMGRMTIAYGTSDHIWVRALRANAAVSCGLTD